MSMRLGLILSWIWIIPATLTTPAKAGPAPKEDKASDSNFIQLKPFQVALLNGTRPNGVLVVEVGAEIPDPALRATFQGAAPRLRDHMLRSLNAFAASEASLEKPVNVRRMAGRLQAVASSYAGERTVRILLINVLAHRR